MYKPKRDSHTRSNQFRSSTPWKKDSYGGNSAVESHAATCAGCGKDCRVPFRPNGSKPVYCINCFKKTDSSEQRRSSAPHRTYESRESTPDLAIQLKNINAKLDTIMRTLEAE